MMEFLQQNNTTPKTMKAKIKKTRAEKEVERFNKWMRDRIKNVHTANVREIYLADKIVYDNFQGC